MNLHTALSLCYLLSLTTALPHQKVTCTVEECSLCRDSSCQTVCTGEDCLICPTGTCCFVQNCYACLKTECCKTEKCNLCVHKCSETCPVNKVGTTTLCNNYCFKECFVKPENLEIESSKINNQNNSSRQFDIVTEIKLLNYINNTNNIHKPTEINATNQDNIRLHPETNNITIDQDTDPNPIPIVMEYPAGFEHNLFNTIQTAPNLEQSFLNVSEEISTVTSFIENLVENSTYSQEISEENQTSSSSDQNSLDETSETTENNTPISEQDKTTVPEETNPNPFQTSSNSFEDTKTTTLEEISTTPNYFQTSTNKFEDAKGTVDDNCCHVIHPEICKNYPEEEYPVCYRHKTRECSGICVSDYVVIKNDTSEVWPCLEVSIEPYKYCGNYTVEDCSACLKCTSENCAEDYCSETCAESLLKEQYYNSPYHKAEDVERIDEEKQNKLETQPPVDQPKVVFLGDGFVVTTKGGNGEDLSYFIPNAAVNMYQNRLNNQYVYGGFRHGFGQPFGYH